MEQIKADFRELENKIFESKAKMSLYRPDMEKFLKALEEHARLLDEVEALNKRAHEYIQNQKEANQ